MPFLSHNHGQIYLSVYVQPGAKKTAVEDLHNGHLKILLAAPPVEGKANDALCRFLQEMLKIPRKNIAIVKGEKSRVKTVALGQVDSEHVRAVLLPPKPGVG